MFWTGLDDKLSQVWLIGHVPPSPGNYFPECVSPLDNLVLRPFDLAILESMSVMWSWPFVFKTLFLAIYLG